MRNHQEQELLPHWRPVPTTALLLPEHHSATSAAQLGGRTQGTSQGDKCRAQRVTCAAGAVDEAGQGPGKECHSPHSSNVQEGTCCLGRQKNTGCQPAPVPVPKTHTPQGQGSALQPVLLKIHSAGREGQAPGGQNTLPALVQPPFISLAAAPGRTAGAEETAVKGREFTPSAHSCAGDFSQHS